MKLLTPNELDQVIFILAQREFLWLIEEKLEFFLLLKQQSCSVFVELEEVFNNGFSILIRSGSQVITAHTFSQTDQLLTEQVIIPRHQVIEQIEQQIRQLVVDFVEKERR